MNIDKLFSDKKHLQSEINFFIENKLIRFISENKELAQAHIKKARHNLEFYKLSKKHLNFNDWLIVILYYALYHSALSLIVNKNYSSKNHQATILLLIKEYGISKDEAELINELSISKEDAELYTNLKENRQSASYSTNTKFTKETIENYENKVLNFINKTEELLEIKK
ncbi:MAG: HEPN domain-containing protein [Candidatus Nanoarchaeia archaeon]|nr:HEPN domain-containing protein [Candidatus Nanoarchaeia archaeon]